jgi:DNA-binding MarR family transcriptional regulator
MDAGKRAIQLIDLQTQWKKQLQDDAVRTSGIALNIVDSLFDLPITYPTLVQRKFKVSHAAASRALKRLEEAGILIEEVNNKDKRTTVYIAEKIVKILID